MAVSTNKFAVSLSAQTTAGRPHKHTLPGIPAPVGQMAAQDVGIRCLTSKRFVDTGLVLETVLANRSFGGCY